MKKRIAILIFTGMVLGLMACGNKTEQTVREEISVENTAEGDTIATEDNTVINDSIDNSEDVDDTLTEMGRTKWQKLRIAMRTETIQRRRAIQRHRTIQRSRGQKC